MSNQLSGLFGGVGQAPDTHVTVLAEVADELTRARKHHPTPYNSAHEGYAVLAEEVDELWDEVKERDQLRARMRCEAIQVAAVAVRFVEDVCDRKKSP